ncbi:TetR family transcriptional regulator [Catenulispora sp. NF23]|uniref:TetR family transcriptional regulator n=1 Tax=Catenulispora pinistramenti TaxID=2705254 RepID=A0ABS5KZJ0_9ACTN|nr:TetR/AcrR family transcriptional regulator [Catenulispora pinistramenti]MBS2537839.1 TetR family transcriptional regulator [Catenulispora pinistramenti]MBS2551339.1 TetR family transcriptional regulator [Catenulispora pinistramenti]
MAPKTDKRPAKRADAERTVTAVLDAALRSFASSPDATVTEIAKAAGVGRVTVYGHFDSLPAIVDALLIRSLAEADAGFAELDLESGTATGAVDRLLHAPWLLGRYQGLLAAATRHLGPEKVRQLHEQVFARIEAVIVRGRHRGEFRTDLPLPWVMASIYALAHAAAAEADAERLPRAEAADLLSTTLLGLLRDPAAGCPSEPVQMTP